MLRFYELSVIWSLFKSQDTSQNVTQDYFISTYKYTHLQGEVWVLVMTNSTQTLKGRKENVLCNLWEL